jgi:hypothetical protein
VKVADQDYVTGNVGTRESHLLAVSRPGKPEGIVGVEVV